MAVNMDRLEVTVRPLSSDASYYRTFRFAPRTAALEDTATRHPMRPTGGIGPRMLLSAMRQIVRRNVTRDGGPVGERDPAPDLAVIRDAVLAGEACSVGQADDDVVVEARAVAKLQQIVRPDALDHGTRTDRASGGDHESEKSSKMSSHDPT